MPTVINQLAAQPALRWRGRLPEAVEEAVKDAIDEHGWNDTDRARLLFLLLEADTEDVGAKCPKCGGRV